MMAAVGHANAAARRTSSSTLSAPDDVGLAVVAREPVEGGRGEGDAVAGADALVAVDARPDGHQRDPTAASPRNASEVASARLEVPSRANSRARRCATSSSARSSSAAISAFVRPSVRSCSSRRSSSSRPAASTSRRGSGLPASPSAVASIGPASSTSSRPTGPGQPRDADRLVGRALRDPRQRRLEVGPDERLDLRRAAGQDGPGRRDDDLQAGVLVEPGLQRLRAPRRRPSRRPSMSPRASATVASAASACAPHGACPGRSGSSSFTCAADRSTSSTSAGVVGTRRRRRRRRAAPPRGQAGQGLAPRRRPPALGRHRDGLLEVVGACPRRRPRPPGPCRATSRAGRARVRDGAHRRRGGRQAEPPLGPVDVAELEQAQRHAAGGEELDRPVALEPRRPMGILAAGQRQVRHHLGPRVDVDPEQHLEVEAGPLALGDELGQRGSSRAGSPRGAAPTTTGA